MNKKSQVKKHIHRFLLNTFCLVIIKYKKNIKQDIIIGTRKAGL